MIDYEFWLWILIAFIIGRCGPRKFYIGNDKRKYEESDVGILLQK